MATQREHWKGHEIVVEAEASRGAAEAATPRLTIDGEPVYTLEVNGGGYIASGFAFAPQPTLVELGKALIDVREG
jgi:hypothetical protein